MSRKRYPRVSDESVAKEPMVKEAKARVYARESYKRNTAIVSVKRRLKKPIKRSKREIAWALEIAGIGEGPADLSENAREYLYNDK
jgi:hypothetical protein